MHNIERIQNTRQPYSCGSPCPRGYIHQALLVVFINYSIKGVQWCGLSVIIRFSPETRRVQCKFAFPNPQKGCSWLGSAQPVSNTHDTSLSENELTPNHHELVYKEKGQLRLYNSMLLLSVIPSWSKRTPNFIIYV